MTAGGESENPDFFRIDPPFLGVGADESNAPLRVLPRREVFRLTFATRNAVSQDDRRNSVRREELRDPVAFLLIEIAVGASRTDDDAGVGRLNVGLKIAARRFFRVLRLARRRARP